MRPAGITDPFATPKKPPLIVEFNDAQVDEALKDAAKAWAIQGGISPERIVSAVVERKYRHQDVPRVLLVLKET